jgi:hypothetical protein
MAEQKSHQIQRTTKSLHKIKRTIKIRRIPCVNSGTPNPLGVYTKSAGPTWYHVIYHRVDGPLVSKSRGHILGTRPCDDQRNGIALKHFARAYLGN